MKILFVCLGNICRSPCAQAITQQLHPEWELDSCGIQPNPGSTDIDKRMKNELEKNGITFSHKPQAFSTKLAKGCDKIICMGEHDYEYVLSSVENKQSVFMLREFHDGKKEIPDPWFKGGFDKTYKLVEKCCKKIE